MTSDEPVLIPHEVLIPGKLHISIIGQSENGEKKLTTRKMVLPVVVLEAGPQDGDKPEAYTPELWEQALIAIGDLTSLTTANKSDIVSAINELASRDGAGSGSSSVGSSKTISGFTFTTTTSSGALFGDINGDGIINNVDLMVMERYMEGLVTNIDTEAADLNCDGIVDSKDLELLQKLIFSSNRGKIIAKIKISYSDGTSDTVMGYVDAPAEDSTSTPGTPGEDGGYYTPAISQPDENLMQISYKPSKDGMPEIAAQKVILPAGKDGKTPIKGVDYFTEADQQLLINAVLGHFTDVSEVGA